MFEFLFEQVLSCSITGSYVILAVILARFFLRKAPKSYSFALWSVVFFRLLCPFTFESSFGLLPKPQSNLTAIQSNSLGGFQEQFTGFDAITVNTTPFSEEKQKSPTAEAEKTPVNEAKPLNLPLLFWSLGVGIFASISGLSVMKLRKQLQVSLHSHKNIYLVDSIDTPFVWGFRKPKIYLPSTLSETQKFYVIAHEEYHIKRGDHITRFLGFITLMLHWFNPLVWVAFMLSGRDMELSVDEKVVNTLMNEEKSVEINEKNKIQKNYATSLLELGVKNNSFAIMYVAPTFGRSETKERVKNIMNMKKTTLWVSGLSTVLVLGMAVGFAMEQPESGESTLFSGIFKEKQDVPPTDLEAYGDYSWVNKDVAAANELSKIFRIAVATLTDLEPSLGTTVTWHTTATNGVYITTNEEEGNAPIQQEIYLTMGQNGKSLGSAESEWGKSSDITFALASTTDGVPFIYTENESLAYHLGISTSADDHTAIPTSDPTPYFENEGTMYEYYAFIQDITPMKVILEEYFYLFYFETQEFTVGDTLTWTLDRENSSQFVVYQQNGNNLQGHVDSILATENQFNLPSASQILETVNVTFEVAQSVDGTLFLFTEDPFFSTTFSIPINEKEEFDPIEVDHNWLLVQSPSVDWWKIEYVSTDLEIDLSAANEVLKVSRIVVATSDAIPDGVTVTWHTDIAENTQVPHLTVTGENDGFREFLEYELYSFFESGGSLLGRAISEEAQEIPFSFTILSDSTGVPQFCAHDAFWAEHFDMPLLESYT